MFIEDGVTHIDRMIAFILIFLTLVIAVAIKSWNDTRFANDNHQMADSQRRIAEALERIYPNNKTPTICMEYK